MTIERFPVVIDTKRARRKVSTLNILTQERVESCVKQNSKINKKWAIPPEKTA